MPKPPALVLRMKMNMSDLQVISVTALEHRQLDITVFASPSPYLDDPPTSKSHPGGDTCIGGKSDIPPSDPSSESFGNKSKRGGLRP
jgi:hypothetical protein